MVESGLLPESPENAIHMTVGEKQLNPRPGQKKKKNQCKTLLYKFQTY